MSTARRVVALRMVAILAAYAALAVVVTRPVWMSPTTTYVGTQDAEQDMWFLSWPAFALSHHYNPLLSTYVNYPTGFNLMWNGAVPALGVLTWPINAIWGAVATYNVILTAAMALAAFFAFLAIGRYVPGPAAAATGGLLYGFSPAMIANQHGHAHVAFSLVTIPLALLLVDELLVRQRRPAWLIGMLIAALGVFQLFVFEEFFATELIVAAVLAAVLAVARRDLIRERYPYAIKAFGIAAAVTALVLAYPVLAVQIGGPDRLAAPVHDPNLFATDLLNPALATRLQAIAPSWMTAVSDRFPGNGINVDGYIGIPLLLLSGFVLVRYWRVTAIRVAGITALLITVLSLGPHLVVAGHFTSIPLPWWIVYRLPLFSDILPDRMMAFVFLPLGIGLAFVLHRIWLARGNVLLGLLVTAVALVPLVPRLPLPTATMTIPAYFSTAAVDEIPAGAVAFTVPYPSFSAMAPMNWQWASRMRFRLLDGYVLGPKPPGHGVLRAVADAFVIAGRRTVFSGAVRAAFIRQLRANRVTVVILGQVHDRAAAVAFFRGLLGISHHVSDGLDIWIAAGGTW
jgi:hypothetical protein